MTSLAPPAPDPVNPGGRKAVTQLAYDRFLHLENSIHFQLVKHSITGLRITLGLVFVGFGILKYFPGVSPAQSIVEATTHVLFLALIPGSVAIKIIATLECFIGVCLLANRWMRLTIWLLAFEFVGILSPIFIFPGRLFAGPHHAPTLLGQYCLKDIILVAAGLVVAAVSFRGGRLVRTDLPPNIRTVDSSISDPEHKLRLVLDGMSDPDATTALLTEHDVSEADFHRWREAVLAAATLSLTVPSDDVPSAGPRAERPAPSAIADRPRMGSLTTIAAVLLLRRL